MGRLECEGAGRPGEHVGFCRNASKKAVAPCGMTGSGQMQENSRRWNWQNMMRGWTKSEKAEKRRRRRSCHSGRC